MGVGGGVEIYGGKGRKRKEESACYQQEAIQVHVSGMQPEERSSPIPESPEPREVHLGP